jgi:RNA polymerase sigma-70 factor (ECF subfamily)
MHVISIKKKCLAKDKLAKMPLETSELRDIETNELKVRLYKAIDELPQQCRKVFRMSRF